MVGYFFARSALFKVRPSIAGKTSSVLPGRSLKRALAGDGLVPFVAALRRHPLCHRHQQLAEQAFRASIEQGLSAELRFDARHDSSGDKSPEIRLAHRRSARFLPIENEHVV